MTTYEEFVAETIGTLGRNSVAPTESTIMRVAVDLVDISSKLASVIADYLLADGEFDIDDVDHLLGCIEYDVTGLIFLMQELGGSTRLDILSQNMADISSEWESTDEIS